MTTKILLTFTVIVAFYGPAYTLSSEVDSRANSVGRNASYHKVDNSDAIKYEVKKTLKCIENENALALEGHYFSLITEAIEPCNTTCEDGLSSQGSCPAACDLYFIKQRLRTILKRTDEQQSRISDLEGKVEFWRKKYNDVKNEQDRNSVNDTIQWIFIFLLVAIIVIVGIVIKTAGKSMLVEFIKHDVMKDKEGHYCFCHNGNAAPDGDINGENDQEALEENDERAFLGRVV